jgi:hypothetical protein
MEEAESITMKIAAPRTNAFAQNPVQKYLKLTRIRPASVHPE